MFVVVVVKLVVLRCLVGTTIAAVIVALFDLDVWAVNG